jgi:hypothetical protein
MSQRAPARNARPAGLRRFGRLGEPVSIRTQRAAVDVPPRPASAGETAFLHFVRLPGRSRIESGAEGNLRAARSKAGEIICGGEGWTRRSRAGQPAGSVK